MAGGCKVPCFHPVPAFIDDAGVFFHEHRSRSGNRSLELPCGQCIGCRLDRARDWSVRIMHEASLWPSNLFLTLTYSPETLSSRENPHTLDYRDVQLFLKRLRDRSKQRFRFFCVGEYGDRFKRPHYHLVLFNFVVKERQKVSGDADGSHTLYRCAEIDNAWGMGHCAFGYVSRQSAEYVARYCLKKVTGSRAEQFYSLTDPSDGRVYRLEPEFMRCSLRPGIGAAWLNRYGDGVFPRDYTVLNGRKFNVPRYYDKLLERRNPDELEAVRYERLQRARKYADNQTPERLAVREEVARARTGLLKRELE